MPVPRYRGSYLIRNWKLVDSILGYKEYSVMYNSQGDLKLRDRAGSRGLARLLYDFWCSFEALSGRLPAYGGARAT